MIKKDTICCIFNLAPHYRAPIYKLIDNEFDAHFYVGDRVNSPIKLMDYEKDLKGFKGTLKYIPLIRNLYYQAGSMKLVFKRYKLYLLTGEGICLSNWLILLINKFSGKRTYLWTHGYYGNENGFRIFVKKIFLKLSTGIFLYGERAKEMLINLGVNPNKLYVIYNSLDYEKQLQIRNRLRSDSVFKTLFSNELPTVVYIGRVQKRKKIDLLIKAISKLKSESVMLNLLIIGDPNKEEKLESLVDYLGLEDNVKFFGPCYDEDMIGKLLFNANVCVSPGNVGLTAIHSLVYGTPVITHNNFSEQMPEYEAISPGVTGDFFIQDSLIDLSSVIKKWIVLTPFERELVRYEAYKIIDKFYNPRAQIKILKEVLN